MLAQADVADGIVATLSDPDGPALTVRTATAPDGEGLDPLFQGLSDEGPAPPLLQSAPSGS